MGLREQQEFLAKLYTDSDFQDVFFRRPAQTARVFGLSDEEVGQVEQLCPAQVRFFAATLQLRRAAQAASLIPALSTALGRRYLRLFHEYLRWKQRCLCEGVRRVPAYLRRCEDAAAFAAFIGARAKEFHLPGWLAELARFERIRLLKEHRSNWFSLSLFRYHITRIARALEMHSEPVEIRRCPRLLFILKVASKWEATAWLPLPGASRLLGGNATDMLPGFSRLETR